MTELSAVIDSVDTNDVDVDIDFNIKMFNFICRISPLEKWILKYFLLKSHTLHDLDATNRAMLDHYHFVVRNPEELTLRDLEAHSLVNLELLTIHWLPYFKGKLFEVLSM